MLIETPSNKTKQLCEEELQYNQWRRDNFQKWWLIVKIVPPSLRKKVKSFKDRWSLFINFSST